VLAEGSRKDLYNEVRTRLKSDMNDKQAEEFLAEEFRTYMLAPNVYTFAEDELNKRSFFRKLLDTILAFFNLVRDTEVDYSIETAFSNLRRGTFGVTQRELKFEFDRERIGKLDPKDTYLALQDFHSTFMNKMLFHKELVDNNLFMLDNRIDDLYKGTKRIYAIMAGREGKDSLAQKILDNYQDVVQEHKRFLKQFQIDLGAYEYNEEVNPNEDEKDSRDNDSYRDNLQINMVDRIKDPIRLLVASLPNITEDTQISGMPSGYKARSVVKFNSMMGYLNRSLVGLGGDFTNYANKLAELSVYKPELKILLQRLGSDQTILSKHMLRLQNLFVSSFGHTQNSPRILRMAHDGTKFFLNPVEESNNKKIKLRWVNRARRIADREDSSIVRSTTKARQKYIVNTKKVLRDIAEAYKEPDDSLERTKAYRDILDSIGIKISNDPTMVNKYDILHQYVKYLSQEIVDRKGKELIVQDLYNADIIKNQKEVTELLNYAREFLHNDDELSYTNQDGNKEYSISLNSRMSNVTDSMGRITIVPRTGEIIIPPELDKIKPWDGVSGNLYGVHSKWWAHRLAGGEFSNILMKGITTPNAKHGAETMKTFFGDFKALEVNALLFGVHPDLRAADRKTEYATFAGKPNYSVDRNSYKEDMTNYLTDELVTSFALLIDPENWGGNLLPYSENAKSLRVFNFLYDTEGIPQSLEEFKIANYTLGKKEFLTRQLAVSKARELAELYLTTYSDFINKSFDNYINQDIKLLEESLSEHKIIEEHFSAIHPEKSEGFYFYGLDPHVIEDKDKFNMTREFDGSISRKSLERVLTFISNEQFVSANEQFKLYLGDPAMYTSPVALLQRVTGATSPKEVIPDSPVIRSNMEALYKRFDGKNKRDSVIKSVVVDDIIVSNDDLAEVYPEYKNINTTDGASNMTLDEQRDLLIRTGNWDYIGHEKTYQYEMQKFTIRMIDLKKTRPDLPFMDRISKGLFEDMDGVFFEHTGGVMPENPVFRGEEIKIKECRPITIIKPQGFGPIDNVVGLNATQYLKTAIAPIFPLSIGNDNQMLEALLSMMENQQGLIAFRKSMKLVVTNKQPVVDKDGKAPVEGYVSQDINYRDIGIQLDISEEGKQEVTASTQRQAIEFYNVYDRGKLIKDIKLGKLHGEYASLINEIIELKRKYLIERFGLVLDETTGKHGLVGEKSVNTFKDELTASLDRRIVPDTVLEGIEIALESNEKVLDMTTSKFQIEEHLMSIIRNEVIARKTAGDMLVQEPNIWYSKKLKFYDGKNAMEVMTSLPYNLIDIAESVGGIDTLNELISEHWNKNIISPKLGEEFFKILTVPMNRIPGQNMSSLDVAKIVAFHPYYHGPKVTLPDGITVKAGSDFDVDKMTSYLNNWEIKDGKVRYFTDLDTIAGKQNRLNEISRESLLHKDRFKELIKPLTTERLKKLSDKAKKRTYDNKTPIEKQVIGVSDNIKTGKLEWAKATTLWYNMQKAQDFFKGKTTTAVGAVINIFNAKSQATPIRMKTYVPIFFKGQRFTKEITDKNKKKMTVLDQDKEYTNGSSTDSDNELISDNLSSFISFFIDTVKDPGAIELADNKTFGMLAMLNMYSKDELNPVGLEMINTFMTQDIVVNYQRIVSRNQSRFLVFNEWAPGKTYKAYTGMPQQLLILGENLSLWIQMYLLDI
jgi:hypothetical protein